MTVDRKQDSVVLCRPKCLLSMTLSRGQAMMVNREQDSAVCRQPRMPPLLESLASVGDDVDSGRALGSLDFRFECLLKGSVSRRRCPVKKVTAH